MNKKSIALNKFLRRHLIGQERAIERIVASYNLSITSLKPPDKPAFSGLFLGPSGCGKTYLAELLAQFILGSKSGLIKIAGAEHSHSHEVSRLLGSPPGYVGHYDANDPEGGGTPPVLSQKNINRAGVQKIISDFNQDDSRVSELSNQMIILENQLAKIDPSSSIYKTLHEQWDSLNSQRAVRISLLLQSRPIPSVILFDEIEKAHETIHNVLLEITSKGNATMGNGEKTDFTGSFVIMTSNIGSGSIADVLSGKGTIGFVAPKESDSVYSVAIKELRKELKPELLGRIKENITVFRPLSKEQMSSIIDIQAAAFITDLMRRLKIMVEITERAKKFIFERSSDHPEYGARPIEDKICHHIIEPFAAFIGSNQISAGDFVTIDALKDDLVFFKDSDSERKIVIPGKNFIKYFTSDPGLQERLGIKDVPDDLGENE